MTTSKSPMQQREGKGTTTGSEPSTNILSKTLDPLQKPNSSTSTGDVARKESLSAPQDSILPYPSPGESPTDGKTVLNRQLEPHRPKAKGRSNHNRQEQDQTESVPSSGVSVTSKQILAGAKKENTIAKTKEAPGDSQKPEECSAAAAAAAAITAAPPTEFSPKELIPKEFSEEESNDKKLLTKTSETTAKNSDSLQATLSNGTPIVNHVTTVSSDSSTKKEAVETESPSDTTITKAKKAPKKPRAKPGFGLRTSRTTIVETGQKRRSCICINSKSCNELMTKWAKVSPPDYHYVQIPKEHIPPMLPSGKTKSAGESSVVEGSNNNKNNSSISDTDAYKNGFRHATLKFLQTKNPIPKDERVALCHYHPEVRPYLFWPKNTPAVQKYAIPLTLATKLGYDTEATRCKGFNTQNYCYAVPTYTLEEAKAEIGSIEKDFYKRVRQIKTNPTQFTRDLRQCEEELKEVHKLRKRNADLQRQLCERRRYIKRLKSVLKIQRQSVKDAQQQQLVAEAASAAVEAHATSTTAQQQYQHQTYNQTAAAAVAYHQQQQLAEISQQQQRTSAIAQTLGTQSHTQFFQPPPPTQEQQAIGLVVGGIQQSNEQQHQQNEHHWTYTQYNPNALSSSAQSEQQQVQPTSMLQYDPTQQLHNSQRQQPPVTSPMDEHNNSGSTSTYAQQQLEAAMAAAVAAGFKDDQEGIVMGNEDYQQQQHSQSNSDFFTDLEDLDDDDNYDGDDTENNNCWPKTEHHRQIKHGGSVLQVKQQKPRKWPRKIVVLPPVSTETVEDKPRKVKRKINGANGNHNKRANTTTSIEAKTKKSDTESRGVAPSDTDHESKKIRKV